MPSARKAVLEILERSPGHQINLADLSKELSERRVLGFGVEVWDVVCVLEKKGLVNYDKETDVVSLPQPDEREKRLTEIRKRLEKFKKGRDDFWHYAQHEAPPDADISELFHLDKITNPFITDIEFLLQEIDRLKAKKENKEK